MWITTYKLELLIYMFILILYKKNKKGKIMKTVKQKLEEQERKRTEETLEQERIDKINCPVCKSINKIQRIKRKSNGIMGPGHSSWITDDYLVCRRCGIHYDDVTKLK